MRKMKPVIIIIILLFTTSAKAQTVVDMHSHIVTGNYMQMLRQHSAELEDGYPLPEWSVEKPLLRLGRSSTPEMANILLTITTSDHLMYGSGLGFVSNAALIAVLNRIKSTLKADKEFAPMQK